MNDNKKYNVSAIIVYTNTDQLAEAQRWLEEQTVAAYMQVIALDNSANRFSSAAKALNYGAERAEGDVLVFMHQDVYLWDLQAIEKIHCYLAENTSHIVGVAGCMKSGKVITDIYETKERVRYGTPTHGKITEVVTVDECLFAMTKERWSKLRFDEACCDNWHGYAVDICCANTLHGGSNYLLPLEICHESRGNRRTASFRRSTKKLIDKYSGTDIKRIQGTCVNVHCSKLGYGWYCGKEIVKDILESLGVLAHWYSWKDKRAKRDAV